MQGLHFVFALVAASVRDKAEVDGLSVTMKAFALKL